MDKGCPEKVEKMSPLMELDMIISRTPNWPFVPSRKRLPNVMAGASAAIKRYRIEDTDFWKFSALKASVQSLR